MDGDDGGPAVAARLGLAGLDVGPDGAGQGQRYVLYYTVRQASGRQCVSVATAASPAGPFIDTSSGPLVCQFDRGGSIDPVVFTDSQGSSYLLWKSDDNALGKPTVLWSRLLAPGGVGFAWWSSSKRLLTQTAAWQAPALEGPTMVKSGTTYFLFYGANDWNSTKFRHRLRHLLRAPRPLRGQQHDRTVVRHQPGRHRPRRPPGPDPLH